MSSISSLFVPVLVNKFRSLVQNRTSSQEPIIEYWIKNNVFATNTIKLVEEKIYIYTSITNKYD